MNVVTKYRDDITDMYIRMHPELDRSKVEQVVQTMIDRSFKDVPCQLHNNVTRERIDTTVTNVLDWIETRDPIISGNGAFFKQHAEELSPKVKMYERLGAKRKAKKKEMYSYPKGSIDYNNCNVAQLSIKVIMNADYGGSATTLSPFYTPYVPPATTATAKWMTTTLICCLEFISDNNNEWSKLQSFNELMDFINCVLTTDTSDRTLIIMDYTPREVTDRLFKRTNGLSSYEYSLLYKYISSMDKVELSKLMHAYSVKHVLRKFLEQEIGRVSRYLKQHQIDLSEITEESLHDAGYGIKPPDEIADDITKINNVIKDNCIYPFMLNDNEARANVMKRVIVCVTDTDSLMVHFADYLNEFQAHTGNFKKSCIIASAIGMRVFIENIIPALVNNAGLACNIKDEYYRNKFVFKNEFTFLAMALVAKKMYAASMLVQEGKPRNPHDIAITGLSFKKRDSPEFLEPIMNSLYDKMILTSEHIDLDGIYKTYVDMKNTLLTDLTVTSKYYTVQSVKDISAYDPSRTYPSQIRGMLVWNNIFPEEEILPMDSVIVIPLSFDLLEQHAGDNPYLSEILRLSLIGNEKKKTDPYICLPEHYHDIPDWLSPAIDTDGASDKLLASFKQMLSLFDMYMPETKNGFMPTRMLVL